MSLCLGLGHSAGELSSVPLPGLAQSRWMKFCEENHIFSGFEAGNKSTEEKSARVYASTDKSTSTSSSGFVIIERPQLCDSHYEALCPSRESSLSKNLSEAKYIQLYARIPSSTLASSSEMTCSSVWSEPFDETRPFQTISTESEVSLGYIPDDAGEEPEDVKQEASGVGYSPTDAEEISRYSPPTLAEEYDLRIQAQFLQHASHLWGQPLDTWQIPIAF